MRLTEYSRFYASNLLRSYGKRVVVYSEGKKIIFEGDELYRGKGMKISPQRKREKIYGVDVLDALIHLWYLSDYLCGKRLVPYIRETLSILKKFNEIMIDEKTEGFLMKISSATVNRLLKKEKDKYRIKRKGRSLTKPGTL